MRTLPFFLACAMLFTTTGRAQEEEETAAEEHSVETAAPENPEPKARPGTAGGAEAATAKPVEGRGLSAGGGDHAPRGKALAGQSQDAGAKACGAKPAGLVLLPNLGNEGASQVRAFGVDRPYAMELKNSAGKRLLRGYLVHAEHPSTSDPIDIEWAISRCPGDFDWSKSPAGASVGSARGGRQTTSYPCRTVGSRTGGRIGWWTGV